MKQKRLRQDTKYTISDFKKFKAISHVPLASAVYQLFTVNSQSKLRVGTTLRLACVRKVKFISLSALRVVRISIMFHT